MRSYGWVGAIILAIGLSLAVISLFVSALDTRFAAEGVTVEAEVVSATARDNSGVGQPVSMVYEVTVRFLVDGETYEVSKSVPRWFYDYAQPIGMEEGTIEVTYAATDPRTVEIVRGRYAKITRWLRLGAFVGLFAGGYWTWTALKRANAVLRLRKSGARISVPVTRLIDTTYSHAGIRQFRIAWAEPNGGEGKSYMLPQESAEKHPPGSEIEIIRDPSGNLPSVWAEDLQ